MFGFFFGNIGKENVQKDEHLIHLLGTSGKKSIRKDGFFNALTIFLLSI